MKYFVIKIDERAYPELQKLARIAYEHTDPDNTELLAIRGHILTHIDEPSDIEED